MLLMTETQSKARANFDIAVFLLTYLGFVVNIEKSTGSPDGVPRFQIRYTPDDDYSGVVMGGQVPIQLDHIYRNRPIYPNRAVITLMEQSI